MGKQELTKILKNNLKIIFSKKFSNVDWEMIIKFEYKNILLHKTTPPCDIEISNLKENFIEYFINKFENKDKKVLKIVNKIEKIKGAQNG